MLAFEAWARLSYPESDPVDRWPAPRRCARFKSASGGDRPVQATVQPTAPKVEASSSSVFFFAVPMTSTWRHARATSCCAKVSVWSIAFVRTPAVPDSRRSERRSRSRNSRAPHPQQQPSTCSPTAVPATAVGRPSAPSSRGARWHCGTVELSPDAPAPRPSPPLLVAVGSDQVVDDERDVFVGHGGLEHHRHALDHCVPVGARCSGRLVLQVLG